MTALGRRDHDFEWQAVIDSDECMLHGLPAAAGVGAVLKGVKQIGPVCLSPGGCPVRLEPGQSRRVKPCHRRSQSGWLARWQLHNRLPFDQRTTHDNHASPEP